LVALEGTYVRRHLHRGWDTTDLARKHGAENVTVMVTMIGGRATNTIGVLSSTEDWTRFGQVQQAVLADPEMQAVMLEGGQIATWESYVSQTIPDM
jgi:hypothetical protein